jgi:hypothetical protein
MFVSYEIGQLSEALPLSLASGPSRAIALVKNRGTTRLSDRFCSTSIHSRQMRSKGRMSRDSGS